MTLKRYINKEYVEELNYMLLKNDYDRILIFTIGGILQTRKDIFEISSNYFKKAIKKYSNEVNLPFKYNPFTYVLEYINTGYITLNSKNVVDIFSISNVIEIKFIMDSCTDFMIKYIDDSNCVDIFRISYMYGCYDVYDVADKYIKKRFMYIINNLIKLRVNELRPILKSSDLVVDTEDFVLNFIIKWGTVKKTNRLNTIKLVNDAVRFTFLTEKGKKRLLAWSSRFKKKTYDFNKNSYKHIPRCNYKNKEFINSDKFTKSFKFKVYNDNLTKILFTNNIMDINIIDESVYNNELLYENNCNEIDKNKTLNESIQQPSNLSKLSNIIDENFKFCASINIGNNIYFLGGVDKYLRSVNSVFAINVKTFERENLPSLIYPRKCPGVTYFNNRIYVIGGIYNNCIVNKVESWSFGESVWKEEPNLIYPRYNPCVVNVNDTIYVIGGISEYDKSVEVYNLKYNKWSLGECTKYSHYGGCAIYHHGLIYVVGGISYINNIKVFNMVESFNHMSCKWRIESCLNQPRFNASICIFDDCIMIVGGFHYGRYIREIELFDDKTKGWNVIGALDIDSVF
ncbi:kelch-like protein [Sheeppox virus]|uniref:Kelch-like protein n=2 Tax=Sheeppox virus TaxID=10266 RepID=A0A3F2YKH2_SHEVT|nr:kelch-like protein [Sheeppox virus]ASY04229.1 kelch [Sheeppox virus]AWX92174.1 kelch-like protein [Sheeppox virus]AWX92175.1 kelch-like protein [Sheeppox virus]QCG74394.1 kelch-like protein [Sheeppox virus]QCG74395.1 kelch-like protein [Sheeppox virus]